MPGFGIQRITHMKRTTFTSLSKPSKNITGSSLSGYVEATRRHLINLFGPPLPGDDVDEYKTTYEWHIDIAKDDEYVGTVSIYDYKSDHSPDPDESIHWHLGSKSKWDAYLVQDFIEGKN